MKIQVTSSEASKMLRSIKTEIDAIVSDEENRRSFVAAVNEDAESLRPEYDFAATQKKIAELQEKVRKIKHALNVFNSTTTVEGFGMTIDSLLVYLPQLNMARAKYAEMRSRLPRKRETGFRSSSAIIEYDYANYDIDEVNKYYNEITETVIKAQTQLDIINNSVKFEIDI